MRYDKNELIHMHVESIQNSNNKPVLLVFKGFQYDFFKGVKLEKLLSLPLSIDITELDNSKAALLPEIFQKIGSIKDQATWCTFEEYLVLGEEILSLYFTIVILVNNIYFKTFPLLYKIPENLRILNTYFQEDVERNDPEQDPIYDVFQKYYGDLKLIDSEWYIVYADDVKAENFYPIPSISLKENKLAEGDNAAIELSDDEDEFLMLTQSLLSNNLSNKNILISVTGDIHAFSHRYHERLLVLQVLCSHFEFVLVTKTTKSDTVRNESEYLDILKKYWGYHSFRELKMYRDIHDPEFKKETVTIPQSQIIDDIVKQALAANRGETYKDIFVTSPTGAGKSVMFQVPAIYLAEKYKLMTIVISPLIGLMTDQVQGLVNRNVAFSATINSEITPVQKLDIMEKIKSGEISILYISPETLLSRSDITQLIGDRTVGLFIIDEAHIVTTWGKAFRSDYWYLGSYLQRLRKEEKNKRKMQFPIATFTATAIYGGMEDMYAETRDSLNLINPISYFGYIKRDDIDVRIKQKEQTKERFSEYLVEKFKILTYRLEQFLSKEQKTLVYFPTVGLINQYIEFAKIYGSERLQKHLTSYYGPLDKERKHSNYLRFRNNEALIMLATKAFGMGIDIPDITNVYHFAPTGNVCDYVQEIGRAARALEQGYAYFDFLPKDFVHVNRLHGISTIRKQQLVQVMNKVLQLLEKDKNRTNIRHLLVNAEEFRYIFQQGSNSDLHDDIDNKLKTALLIIEKDFKAKMGYSPIIARPRSVFSREYFMVQKEYEPTLIKQYGNYFRKIAKVGKESFGDIYSCDMKGLWEGRYHSLSFPQFKYKFHSKDESLKLDFLEYLLPVLQIEISLKALNLNRFFTELHLQLERTADILGSYAKKRNYFSIDDVAKDLRKVVGGDKYFCENLASILVYSADNYDRIMRKHSNFYNRFITYNEAKDLYTIQNSGYAGFVDWIRVEMKHLLSKPHNTGENENDFKIFLPKVNRQKIEKTFILLGILEALGLLIYRVNGGDNPEIFMRINSKLQIERSLQDPNKYKNYILENVHLRHETSVAMLTYLFKNQVDNRTFWEHIENYFLGKIPDEVLAEVR
ncbi:ATP-dependent DNA helicase RecQ [Brevibacillus composti]|uniref:DNA 3'-5' helicase n=1 Tax=Brevibacillus composti TaxID=2796470 RepID=A0ABX7Z430_9BACL|nr:DEAD/DEAH box helicase [Brevibacillus composti]QUO41812.1 ATP-dependent DNA helicase RecQ [Brevibacillus composti]